jgi:hypothetical protein
MPNGESLFTESLDSLTNQLINHFTNELSFITWGELTRDHNLEDFVLSRVLCYYLLPKKGVLASRCLVMDYSRFQVSCHNMYALICIRDIVVESLKFLKILSSTDFTIICTISCYVFIILKQTNNSKLYKLFAESFIK